MVLPYNVTRPLGKYALNVYMYTLGALSSGNIFGLGAQNKIPLQIFEFALLHMHYKFGILRLKCDITISKISPN